MAKAATDAIEYLLKDHATLRNLFSQYARTAGSNFDAKKQIALNIVREASQHDTAETSALYPPMRILLQDGSKIADHSLQEHQQLREVLYKIEGIKSDMGALDRYVSEAHRLFDDHVKEEERNIFPQLRNAMTDTQMQAMRAALEAAKALGPTHPHPAAPLKPTTGGAILGPLTGMMDRVKDFFGGSTVPRNK
jgi:hemerythrin superfamily protein